MFHPDTQFLLDRWIELAGATEARGGLPHRREFRPEILGARLARAFLLEAHGPASRFRLAGGWIEAFQDRPLSGAPFLDLWCDASPGLVLPALAQARREARPVVIVAQAGPAARHVEVGLAPLLAASGRRDLFIGLVTAAPGPDLVTGEPHRLTARLTTSVDTPGRPNLRLIAAGGPKAASGR